MDVFIEKFLGRNFHLAILVIALSYTLCLWGHMTGGEFAGVATAVFTAFRAGDAAVNWIRKDKPDPIQPTLYQPPEYGIRPRGYPSPQSFPLTGNQDSNEQP
jgi:hypothetical protein